MADPDQVAGWSPVLKDLVARMGVRSLALVPLLSRGRFPGLLALCWTERHPLDRDQEALLGLLQAQGPGGRLLGPIFDAGAGWWAGWT